MKMKLSVSLVCAFMFVASAQPVLACRALAPKGAVSGADIIFIGTPINMDPVWKPDRHTEITDITFKVTRTLKGPPLRQLTIRYFGDACTALYPANHATMAAEGEHLIFGREDEGEGYKAPFWFPNIPLWALKIQEVNDGFKEVERLASGAAP